MTTVLGGVVQTSGEERRERFEAFAAELTALTRRHRVRVDVSVESYGDECLVLEDLRDRETGRYEVSDFDTLTWA